MTTPPKNPNPQDPQHQLNTLRDRLAQCPPDLQTKLQRKLNQAQQRLNNNQPITQILTRLTQQLNPPRPPQTPPTPHAEPEQSEGSGTNPQPHQLHLHYPPDLPITQHTTEILNALNQHQVIILTGETGSGKTTQLPKLLYQHLYQHLTTNPTFSGRSKIAPPHAEPEQSEGSGIPPRNIQPTIAHTQPRRIAARTLAQRIAQETQTTLGQAVGYKVRFNDKTNPNTAIKIMTDGILLAETQTNPNLKQYAGIIIDEAHERSLNIDFLLGYLKQILPKRPDLKIIITSATIDPDRFANHFTTNNQPAPIIPPIINVSGRTHPVQIQYHPPHAEPKEQRDEGSGTPKIENRKSPIENASPDLPTQITTALTTITKESNDGDVLVFLPTERDILQTAKHLRAHYLNHPRQKAPDILPLYARLSNNEQQKIFNWKPNQNRRVVLATNVAETSLTVPGIRYVIDTGLARTSRYSARAKVQRLPIEPISQAAADQRKGRCGRLGPGTCIRLYAEDDFNQRDPFTTPEILRSNLATVILRMHALKLGRVDQFPFIEPPKPATIRDGYRTLYELNAIDDRDQLTKLGRRLAKLPVDVRIARMLLEADRENCLSEVLIIAAALEAQDPRIRPIEQQQAADEKHAAFTHPRSDFLTLLQLWDFYHQLKDKLSHRQLDRACRDNFLSPLRLREWTDLHRQLRQTTKDLNLIPNPRKKVSGTFSTPHAESERSEDSGTGTPPTNTNRPKKPTKPSPLENAIHRTLLAGLLSNIATKSRQTNTSNNTSPNTYQAPGNKQPVLWPGSTCFTQKPQWIVAAELVETNRLYARTVAPVQPQWIERLADHLVKRDHSEPRWDEQRQQAICTQKTSLFGLVLQPRKTTPLKPHDPAQARELFIHHALVDHPPQTNNPTPHAESERTSGGEGSGKNPKTQNKKPNLPQFLPHNHQLLQKLETLEAKSRQRDLLADHQTRFAFYDRQLPAHIADWPTLHEWYEAESKHNARLLFMTEADLLADDTSNITQHAFPDHLDLYDTQGNITAQLPLTYQLEPGSNQDGVTLTVPLQLLNQLNPNQLTYLVPGLLHEKVSELIRTLPKQLRKSFVPAPEFAKRFINDLNQNAPTLKPGEEIPGLTTQLATYLSNHAGYPIDPAHLNESDLPPHLQMNIKVITSENETEKTKAESRNLNQLREQLASELRNAYANLSTPAITDTPDTPDTKQYNQTGLTQWTVGNLPESIDLQQAGLTIKAYPALTDEPHNSPPTVGLYLYPTPEEANHQHAQGLTRLYALTTQKEITHHLKQHPQHQPLTLLHKTTHPTLTPTPHAESERSEGSGIKSNPTQSNLTHHLTYRIAQQTFNTHPPHNNATLRTPDQFAQILDQHWADLRTTTHQILQLTHTIYTAAHQILLALEDLTSSQQAPSRDDIQHRLTQLITPDFLTTTPWIWLQQYPRYLAALQRRLEKITSGQLQKDQTLTADLRPFERELQQHQTNHAARNLNDPNLTHFRWMLEEYHVSLHAQDLGTSIPVSPKRLNKQLKKIQP